MYFAEIAVLPAILFSPEIKVATLKTAIYSTVRVHFRKFRWQYNVLRSLSIVQRCCYFVDLWLYFKSFGVMNYALFWCAYTARGISTNHARLICCGTVSVTGQDGGCKQRGQTATIRLTRQIWGIWKLRPAYSPETPNLGQNRWCFVPCDLEIWWMTSENNRASLLCCFKLCATFHSHWWIQTGVTVWKRPIWVKFDDS